MTCRPGSADRKTVAISGSSFVATPTVTLDHVQTLGHTQAKVLKTTAGLIDATIPYTMEVGVYDLTVTNPDGRSDTLPQAFEVYGTIALTSPYLVTFGPNAKEHPHNTPRYQSQLIFFEVPQNLENSLFFHIFDADTGGSRWDDDQGDGYETEMCYTLYGSSGTVLATATIGEDNNLDGKWGYQAQPAFSFGSFSPNQGESVGDRYIFELAVQGLTGNDANWCQVALSESDVDNKVRSDVRMFALSWTVLANDFYQPHLRLYPYVNRKAAEFQLGSLGCDTESDKGCLLIETPLHRRLQACCVNGSFTPADFPVETGEDEKTWTVDLSGYHIEYGYYQYLAFWAKDGKGLDLPIFTRPPIWKPRPPWSLN